MALNFSKIKKLPVETESGVFLGYVTDCSVEPSLHNIIKYIVARKKIFTSSPLMMIAPNQIIKITPEKIIVDNTFTPEKQKQTIKETLTAPLEKATSTNAEIEN